MTSISQNDDRLMRYGHPLYEVNPSLSSYLLVKLQHPQRRPKSVDDSLLSTDRNGMKTSISPAHMVNEERKSIPASGEVTNDLFLNKELDREQFVKFYLDGIRQYAQLNKSGTNLFEFVYERLSRKDSQDKDTICLNYILANKWRSDLTRRTYSRGIADLLDKEFLFRSIVNDLYFINIHFMFNGDRLVLAKSYQSLSTNY
jgi:hypothetical protein